VKEEKKEGKLKEDSVERHLEPQDFGHETVIKLEEGFTGTKWVSE
jgi:hypothetical protein